jgi:hypothetical protein
MDIHLVVESILVFMAAVGLVKGLPWVVKDICQFVDELVSLVIAPFWLLGRIFSSFR